MAIGQNLLPPEQQGTDHLDALDFPARLMVTVTPPSWGVQLFGGAAVFAEPVRAYLFHAAVEGMYAGFDQ